MYARTATFLEPVDYLNLKMTGRRSASFDSIAAHWVTDNRTIDRVTYDQRLLDLTGLDRSMLPDLVHPGTIMGALTTEAAADLGVPSGLPVAVGSGDVHSAVFGSGAVADFAAHLYIGTSSWISAHVPFKKTAPTSNVASLPAALAGKYLIVDEHETAGACLTFLRDNLGFGKDFDALDAMVDTVGPGSGRVMFTPWLNGERSPVDDHTIRGGFHNLSLSTSRAQMVRAVYEGVALNSRWLLDAVERFAGRRLESLAFIGGGANSDQWAQIHADVLDREIRQVADPVLANVRGAALITLMALDRITVDQIPAMVEVKRTYVPDRSTTAEYDLSVRAVRDVVPADQGNPPSAQPVLIVTDGTGSPPPSVSSPSPISSVPPRRRRTWHTFGRGGGAGPPGGHRRKAGMAGASWRSGTLSSKTAPRRIAASERRRHGGRSYLELHRFLVVTVIVACVGVGTVTAAVAVTKAATVVPQISISDAALVQSSAVTPTSPSM